MLAAGRRLCLFGHTITSVFSSAYVHPTSSSRLSFLLKGYFAWVTVPGVIPPIVAPEAVEVPRLAVCRACAGSFRRNLDLLSLLLARVVLGQVRVSSIASCRAIHGRRRICPAEPLVNSCDLPHAEPS